MMEQFDLKKLEPYVPMITDYGMKVVGAIAIFVLAVFVSNKFRNIVSKALDRAKVDATLSKFAGTAAKWAIMVLAVIAILGYFGVQTASFAAVIAAAGLAIGLAFQGTLSNFAAGVMLLIFRPFKVGQYVKIGGEEGIVDEISVFTTTLDTVDRRRVILPNSSVFGNVIENVSHHAIRRCDVAVGTAYDADLQKTRDALTAVAANVDGVLKDPEPAIVLTNLGASSIDWAIRVHVKAEDYWAVREKLLWDVKYALDKADIGIPFPQMDVNINQLPAEYVSASKQSLNGKSSSSEASFQ